MIQLRPHQEANLQGILTSLKTHGGAIDASGMGTGKTFTALALCKMLGARPAVITRKAIIPSWVNSAKAIGVDPLFVVNYEHALTSNSFQFGKRRYETRKATKEDGSVELVDVVEGYDWDIPESRVLFFFDESQSLRGKTSQVTKMAIAAAKTRKTVMLSATPFTSPMEAYSHGYITKLFNEGTYYRWLLNHGCRKNFMGHLQFVGDYDEDRGLAEMRKVHAELFPSRGVRTRPEDIPGFPETLILPTLVETGKADEITSLYLAEIEEARKMDHARAVENVDPDFHHLVEPLQVTVDLRARQEVELLKVPVFVEEAKAAHAMGMKVILFVNFERTIAALSSALKTKSVISGSSVFSANRHNVEQEFQANRVDFCIVQNDSGGAGLSLHDPTGKVERMCLISPTWNAVTFKQVLGRARRLNGAKSTQKILFAANTIEEKVYLRVKNRENNIDMLVDGDLDVTR